MVLLAITRRRLRARRHHESGATMIVQVAVEVADPHVVPVRDFAFVIHARESEREPWIVLDLVRVDFIDVERRIRHHEIGFALSKRLRRLDSLESTQ